AERRALKTHLRSCPGCRTALGARAKALTWLPLPSLEWLRSLAGIGGAPAAAKIGAGVATATRAAAVGGGGRVAMPEARHTPPRRRPARCRRTATAATTGRRGARRRRRPERLARATTRASTARRRR